MKQWKILMVWLLAMTAPLTGAQENESHLKASEVKESKTNLTPGQDVDEVITNNLLRAESGSKSRWSIASALVYSGASIEKPLDQDRPNIAKATGTIDKSVLDGNVSVKYNLSTKHSLMAGIGLRWIAPLEKSRPRDYEDARFDADNPYITYQYLYKWAGVQSVFQLQPMLYTNANLVGEGYVSSLSVTQDNIYNLGKSGLAFGVSVWIQGGYYNKSGPKGTPGSASYVAEVRADQMDYGVGIEPVMEYEINDKFNLRTVTNLWNFEHLRSESGFSTYHVDTVYQSVGVGISVTRDIFVYPNLQFLPDNVRPELTNVALNTNINLF